MRFGNGAWTMMPGVSPTYLTRVDGTRVGEREVVLDVTSRPEKERWATLAGHMFTVTISAPAENVVRVQVQHHKGRRRQGPFFVLNAEATALVVRDSAERVEIESGGLRVLVNKDPWGLHFVDSKSGEVVTSSPYKALGMMEVSGAGTFMREQLTLRPGELVYGLGERFQALVRNGQSVDMWNDDCGTCSDKGYKDVPFYMTSAGYGVFVNSPARVSFEIGTEQVMRAQFGIPGEDLDYFVIYGPNPKDVLTRLGALSGRPALPPAWSFGLWLTTSFVTNYDEKTVMGFVDGMRDRGIPLHVFHFDCFWMKAHHWVDFKWDESVFPDPEAMLKRLKAKGLRICVWINSYVGERSYLFDEGAANGFLLKRANGDVYQRPKWQAGMGIVDFTNPAAVQWYQGKLRSLLAMGVDAFKTDFGEEIPTDVVYFDGSDPEKAHNYYTYLYNKAVFDLLRKERGEGEALVFARSATATCQQFPVHWGGDSYGTFESMAESLRGGLSLALCGFGFWSHDIGGFESTSPPSVYKRWIAFGLLSSHSRLHGNASYRVPWLYDEEAVDVLRHFTQIKCTLMPYLMSAAVEAVRTSVPMMRAMLLEFPADPDVPYARPAIFARRRPSGRAGLPREPRRVLSPRGRMDPPSDGRSSRRRPMVLRRARLLRNSPLDSAERGRRRGVRCRRGGLRLCRRGSPRLRRPEWRSGHCGRSLRPTWRGVHAFRPFAKWPERHRYERGGAKGLSDASALGARGLGPAGRRSGRKSAQTQGGCGQRRGRDRGPFGACQLHLAAPLAD